MTGPSSESTHRMEYISYGNEPKITAEKSKKKKPATEPRDTFGRNIVLSIVIKNTLGVLCFSVLFFLYILLSCFFCLLSVCNK